MSTKYLSMKFLAKLSFLIFVVCSTFSINTFAQSKPNFIFILTDDLDKDPATLNSMTNTMSLIANKGTKYNKFYVNMALCCSSRATILTGLYEHNHGIWSNRAQNGGAAIFHTLGHEERTFAVHLKNAGYETGFMGSKYLNAYPNILAPMWRLPDGKFTFASKDENGISYKLAYDAKGNRVFGEAARPLAKIPGWSYWAVKSGRSDNTVESMHPEFDFYNTEYIEGLYDKPVKVAYSRSGGDQNFIDAVAFEKSVDFIKQSVAKNKPFFAHISLLAPHVGLKKTFNQVGYSDPKNNTFAVPPVAPQLENQNCLTSNRIAPRTPSFNEEDITDKTAYAAKKILTDYQIRIGDIEYNYRVCSMMHVDNGVKKIVDELAKLNILDNTYLIFTSDNGYHIGQHRFTPGKLTAYEEDINVPFYIRGPGVKKNFTSNLLFNNADLGVTFLKLAKLQQADFTTNSQYSNYLQFIKNSDGNDFSRHIRDGATGPLRYTIPLSRRMAEISKKGLPLNGVALTNAIRDRVPMGVIPYGVINYNVKSDGVTPLHDYREDFKGIRIFVSIPALPSAALNFTYIHYDTGFEELYDNSDDPFQLSNLLSNNINTSGKKLNYSFVNEVRQRTTDLYGCKGTTCRILEKLNYSNKPYEQ